VRRSDSYEGESKEELHGGLPLINDREHALFPEDIYLILKLFGELVTQFFHASFKLPPSSNGDAPYYTDFLKSPRHGQPKRILQAPVGLEAVSIGLRNEPLKPGPGRRCVNYLLEVFHMKKFAMIAGVVVLSLCHLTIAAEEEKFDIKVLEKNLDRALKAYNDGDSKNFWAELAKSVDALKTKETYDALYTIGYKPIYGKLVNRGEMIKDKSSLEGPIGLVRYLAEFEKDKKVEIDVNWAKEGKDVKFIQIQINKLQE
jgi:hypothetical protein